ncbi:ATP-binding cassette domain-containing protein [Aneurinibacillus migulanus]|uniref:ABC-2 type transport system ATP-binding protein n=1 Tax=Aneurinibacillus migulanus TaxID=47500 RepID=A0A0D1VUP2_ANEMI|nr:ATP-binding cassette domain-containing protein [Aneurinibacillus migulanus]KIV49990.1 bacitracin ABC transporter ATP-binding protein [Aneurinibacillus migulanus]KON97788.1 bacitracin ABC transporter ATP-binding protein [Aneurinibacillus migulanus]MED0894654.1 ATP-binding cassette domain-containing protein [Aneurinibacillus migulanus]MED1619385.1 ATP-binding cassette domain-containing protein [Aneurinibacillus migulanus]SDJ74597.1 ABC-2 type transport system ATP-binding protein [Aneurinibaci
MSYVVQTNNLTKKFQEKDVVSNVNMNIKKGEIYGFLGANGAGKSTVMKMLTNMIKPSYGDITIFGEPLKHNSFDYLKRIGSMIEYPIFFEKMTVLENLELHCAYMGYHNKQAIRDALDRVGLENVENKLPKNISLGMRQRLCVARAIITKPEFLILDEPINGLDPAGIKAMRQLFKMLNKEYGMTLLISSHIIGEIEQIADTIGVIKSGKLIEEAPMDAIKARNTEYIELVTSNQRKAAMILHDKLGINNLKVIDHQVIRIYATEVPQSAISKTLILEDISIESINKKRTSLEEYFIKKVELDQPTS